MRHPGADPGSGGTLLWVSIGVVHLVDPPQVVEHVDVDGALPGAARHSVPAPDAVGHQSHQIMSPAEPISEMGDQF